MRRHANSAVRRSHPVAAQTAVRRHHDDLGAAAAATADQAARSRRSVPGQPSAPGLGETAPPPSMQSSHQRVVGVAPLHPHARRGRDGAGRVQDLAASPLEPPPGLADAQREVRILPVRPREPLVEPVDLLQRLAAVSHVGSGPAGALEPGRGPLPVRGPTVVRQGHLDAPLAGGVLGAQRLEVLGQRGGPARRATGRRRRRTRPTAPASPASRGCAPLPAPGRNRRRPAQRALPELRRGSLRGAASTGRSSTTTTSSGMGPGCEARSCRSHVRLSRPTEGMTTAYRSGERLIPPPSHRGPGVRRTSWRDARDEARAPRRPRVRSRRAPAPREACRPSGGRPC